MPPDVIEVDGLRVEYRLRRRWLEAVSGVSFAIARREILGMAGESGCGKSSLAHALLGGERPGSRITGGRIRFEGRDLLALPEAALRRVRGARIGFVPQNPAGSLTPSMCCGRQVTEVIRFHGLARGQAAIAEALALFERVGLPDPPAVFHRYPHQLSGGQQQRVVIAMALACRPALVVLDEPTTGLDVMTQWRILTLIAAIRDRFDTAFLYVSHDLGALSQICDRIAVMYAGELVEIAPTGDLFTHPRHPYTRSLLASMPQIDRPPDDRLALRGTVVRGAPAPGCRFAPRCDFAEPACTDDAQHLAPAAGPHRVACRRWPELAAEVPALPPPQRTPQPGVAGQPPSGAEPLLEVRDLGVVYRDRRLWPWRRAERRAAVHGLSFCIPRGQTLALVGESGSGKSTVARAIEGLVAIRAGRVLFAGRDITLPIRRRQPSVKRRVQIVFQNPDASLNPRHTVASIIGRPLSIFHRLRGEARYRRAAALLDATRLDQSYLGRLPRQLSGGERQRVAIARALAAEPDLLICDEILSALDVSVEASILQLMRQLQQQHGLTYLFISHDLSVVRWLAHRVAVLFQGELCEIGPIERVFAPPYHPYTEMLLRAVPRLPRGRGPAPLPGEARVPDATPPAGCPFAGNCPRRIGSICDHSPPPLQTIAPDHAIRCHIPSPELRRQQDNLGAGV